MAFEDVQAEIGLIVSHLCDHPADRFELEENLREKLNALRAYGMPLPRDLLDLEVALDRGLVAQAKGANAR